MTSTERVAESFGGDADGSGTPRLGVYGTGLGIASGLCGLGLLLAFLFSLGESTRDSLVFGAAAAWNLGTAGLAKRHRFDARAMRPVPTISAVVVAYLYVAVVSTIVYLGSGAMARVDDALYESVAGVATSSLTLLDDPSVLGRGELIWRAATQWIGGLGALGLVVGLLPFLGGARELADPRRRGSRRLALAPRPMPALRRVLMMYGIVSVVVTVALIAVGMSLPDAVAHMMSSVSTGGFSTHADSIGHYDSRLVDLVMIVVMAGAGFSLALVWMLYRGQFHDTRRVFELRVYGAVLVGATGWVYAFHGTDHGATVDRVVDSLFTVVSLSTTTGHHTADWGLWDPGAQLALVILLVVGGMAGSVAGGLHWFRVIGLSEFVLRELKRQLHPRAVRAVKVGHASISEASVERWHSQLVLTIFVGGTGAVALAFFGSDVLEALTLALSAVSTAGPALAEDGGTLVTAASLSRSDRAVLMPLMLMGRVSIYPALVVVGLAYFALQRRVSAWQFRRRRQRSRPRPSGRRR